MPTPDARPSSHLQIAFPPLPAFAPPVPEVRTLRNGLRVFLMEDHELPLVSVRAMARAGAAYEAADKVGLASVTTTVMRTGGTAANPGDRLDDELGSLAAAIDVSNGALTTTASAECLSDRLPRVLELFADVLRRPAFPEDKIELARMLLRTAISRRNDQVGAMAHRAFQIAMYGKASPFAREPEYATVDAIARDDLRAFHDRFLRPDRMRIGLVGDFDTERAFALVDQFFGDWPKASAPLPAVATDPIALEGRRVFYAEKDDVNQTHVLLGAPGVRRSDPDWPALRVASFILGAGGFSSRLVKKVRTELGLAYAVGGGFSAEYDRTGLFRAVCQTKTESAGQAIEAIVGEIERFLAAPPDDEELATAKDQIQNAEIFEYDSREEVLARRMTLDHHGYPPDFLERVNARIRGVEAREVHAAIQRHVDPRKLNVVAVGPRDGMDRPLSDFGPVTTLDLAIPSSPPRPGSAGIAAP
ncbi:MAG TPA: pitrilysin family protein [Planctomycetota bacterium]|nr:pitrilysin family protein [Planctomycetota bacterium]